jgi:hypothetical protein
MRKALYSHALPSLVAAFFLALAIPAFAGDPVHGVDVKLGMVGGKTKVVKTDADGKFTFDNLAEGTYTLTISHEACMRAINTTGTGATVRLADGEHTFSVACDAGVDVLLISDQNDAAMEQDVKSPRDLATGQASGKRMHKPFVITKEWGASSPQLKVVVSKTRELTGHVTLIK